MRDIDLTSKLDRLSAMTAANFVAAGGVKTCEPLKPGLKVYVEYSNETWNGMFKQAHYCADEGTALGLDTNRWTAGFRFHAWAAIRLFRAVDLVFGEDSPRVIKVLASHAANSWVTQQHLKVMEDPRMNPWRVKSTAVALAPYFGHKVDGTASNAAEQLRADIQRCATQSEKQLKLAQAAGLKLIAYEGGQHVTTQAKAINRNPIMFDLYQEYLREMSKYYEHFCHYAHVGQADDRGAWGAIETTGQPLHEAHKYRALAEWAKGKNE